MRFSNTLLVRTQVKLNTLVSLDVWFCYFIMLRYSGHVNVNCSFPIPAVSTLEFHTVFDAPLGLRTFLHLWIIGNLGLRTWQCFVLFNHGLSSLSKYMCVHHARKWRKQQSKLWIYSCFHCSNLCNRFVHSSLNETDIPQGMQCISELNWLEWN